MSEEVAAAIGTIDYWQRRAEQAEQREREAQDYITRLRRWGSRLLLVIDEYPHLIPIYASALRWRIDGPPAVVDDETQLLPLFAAAAAWRTAIETCNGVADAEQALLGQLAALEKREQAHGAAEPVC